MLVRVSCLFRFLWCSVGWGGAGSDGGAGVMAAAGGGEAGWPAGQVCFPVGREARVRLAALSGGGEVDEDLAARVSAVAAARLAEQYPGVIAAVVGGAVLPSANFEAVPSRAGAGLPRVGAVGGTAGVSREARLPADIGVPPAEAEAGSDAADGADDVALAGDPAERPGERRPEGKGALAGPAGPDLAGDLVWLVRRNLRALRWPEDKDPSDEAIVALYKQRVLRPDDPARARPAAGIGIAAQANYIARIIVNRRGDPVDVPGSGPRKRKMVDPDETPGAGPSRRPRQDDAGPGPYELDQRQLTALARLGLEQVDVPQDGDCLFNALSQTAPRAFTETSAQASAQGISVPEMMRRTLAQTARAAINDSRHPLNGLVAGYTVGQDPRAVVNALATTGSWAGPHGDIAPYLAAYVYSLDITVILRGGGEHRLTGAGVHPVTLVQVPGHWYATAPALLHLPGLRSARELVVLADAVAAAYREYRDGRVDRDTVDGHRRVLDEALSGIQGSVLDRPDRNLARNLRAALAYYVQHGNLKVKTGTGMVDLRDGGKEVNLTTWLANLRSGSVKPRWARGVLDQWTTGADVVIDENRLAELAGDVVAAYEAYRAGGVGSDTVDGHRRALDKALKDIQDSDNLTPSDRNLARNLRAALAYYVTYGNLEPMNRGGVVDLRDGGNRVTVGGWLDKLRRGMAEPRWAEGVLKRFRARLTTGAGVGIDGSWLTGLAGAVAAARPEYLARRVGSDILDGHRRVLDEALQDIQVNDSLTPSDRILARNLRAALAYYVTYGNLDAPDSRLGRVDLRDGGDLVDLGRWVGNLRRRTDPRWAGGVLTALDRDWELGARGAGGAAARASVRDAGAVRVVRGGPEVHPRRVPVFAAVTDTERIDQARRIVRGEYKGAEGAPLGEGEEFRITRWRVTENRLEFRPESDWAFPWRDPSDPLRRVFGPFADEQGRLHPGVRVLEVRLGIPVSWVSGMLQDGRMNNRTRSWTAGEVAGLVGRLREDVRGLMEAAIAGERNGQEQVRPRIEARILGEGDLPEHEREALAGQYGAFLTGESLGAEAGERPLLSQGRVLGLYPGVVLPGEGDEREWALVHPNYPAYAMNIPTRSGNGVDHMMSAEGFAGAAAFANTRLVPGSGETDLGRGGTNAQFVTFRVQLTDARGGTRWQPIVALVGLDSLYDPGSTGMVIANYGEDYVMPGSPGVKTEPNDDAAVPPGPLEVLFDEGSAVLPRYVMDPGSHFGGRLAVTADWLARAAVARRGRNLPQVTVTGYSAGGLLGINAGDTGVLRARALAGVLRARIAGRLGELADRELAAAGQTPDAVALELVPEGSVRGMGGVERTAVVDIKDQQPRKRAAGRPLRTQARYMLADPAHARLYTAILDTALNKHKLGTEQRERLQKVRDTWAAVPVAGDSAGRAEEGRAGAGRGLGAVDGVAGEFLEGVVPGDRVPVGELADDVAAEIVGSRSVERPVFVTREAVASAARQWRRRVGRNRKALASWIAWELLGFRGVLGAGPGGMDGSYWWEADPDVDAAMERSRQAQAGGADRGAGPSSGVTEAQAQARAQQRETFERLVREELRSIGVDRDVDGGVIRGLAPASQEADAWIGSAAPAAAWEIAEQLAGAGGSGAASAGAAVAGVTAAGIGPGTILSLDGAAVNPAGGLGRDGITRLADRIIAGFWNAHAGVIPQGQVLTVEVPPGTEDSESYAAVVGAVAVAATALEHTVVLSLYGVGVNICPPQR
jgi:hypothetical protein